MWWLFKVKKKWETPKRYGDIESGVPKSSSCLELPTCPIRCHPMSRVKCTIPHYFSRDMHSSTWWLILLSANLCNDIMLPRLRHSIIDPHFTFFTFHLNLVADDCVWKCLQRHEWRWAKLNITGGAVVIAHEHRPWVYYHKLQHHICCWFYLSAYTMRFFSILQRISIYHIPTASPAFWISLLFRSIQMCASIGH